MRRPVLCGCILFIAGILIARFVRMSTTLWLVAAGASFFAALLFVLLWKQEYSALKAKSLSVSLALAILFLGAFWYSFSRYPESFSEKYVGLSVQGVGVVTSYPKENEYGMWCYLRVEEIRAGAKGLANISKVLLKTSYDSELMVFPGDTVIFTGVLSLPAEARNPGEFNYREYLAHQEVFLIVNSYQGEVKVAEKGQGIQTLAARGRVQVVQHLQKILPERERGLILGMLFGDTQLMAEEEYAAYKRTGVVHLFAVSGLHVGMILGLVWFLLSFFNLKPLLRLLIGAFVLTEYGFMVGWSASIIRATVMALLGLLALTIGRKNDLYNSIGAAAWIVLLLHPGELFQVGFQLSFITTIGIVYLTPWLEKKGCSKILAVPLVATMSSSPILAYHFCQISLISPLANILAVAVSSVATTLSFLGAFFTWFSPVLATPFFLTAGFMMYLLSELLIWCAEIKWAGLNVARPPFPLILLWYSFLAALPVLSYARYLIREIPFKLKAVVASLFLLTALFVCWPASREMEVIFLDVGQGDSILLFTPTGKTVLIDGGGTPSSSFSVGKNIVTPVLSYYGVNKIDLMLMSHHHFDHSEGLSEIIPDFQVGAFLQPPSEENNEIEKMIKELCQLKKTPLKEVASGQRIILEQDVFLEVLYPSQEDDFRGNNRSLVLRLIYQGSSWLLTGDIENEAIEKLLARGVDLRADILKIPHHGSLTSFHPQFYEKVNPQAVVISVGKNNFNQPHPEVKKYFLQKGISVYITRDRGAILTKSNGQKIILKTFL